MRPLGLDADTAAAAALLGPERFPGDTADRIIYATASRRGLPLVTKDERIRRFDPPRTVW